MQDRQVAALATALAVTLLGFEPKDADLGAALVADDSAGNVGAVNERRTEGDIVIVTDHQDLVEDERGVGLGGEFVYFEGLAGLDSVLPSAGPHQGVQG